MTLLSQTHVWFGLRRAALSPARSYMGRTENFNCAQKVICRVDVMPSIVLTFKITVLEMALFIALK